MMETRRQAGREGPSDRAYPDFDSAFDWDEASRGRGDEGTGEGVEAADEATLSAMGPYWNGGFEPGYSLRLLRHIV
jgi:hypothetical protein